MVFTRVADRIPQTYSRLHVTEHSLINDSHPHYVSQRSCNVCRYHKVQIKTAHLVISSTQKYVFLCLLPSCPALKFAGTDSPIHENTPKTSRKNPNPTPVLLTIGRTGNSGTKSMYRLSSFLSKSPGSTWSPLPEQTPYLKRSGKK